jgi:hypothetical protein
MEVETYTLPTHLRLKQRAQSVIVNLCTLPRDHPIQDVVSRARKRCDNVGSKPQFPLAGGMNKNHKAGTTRQTKNDQPKANCPLETPRVFRNQH